VASNNLLIVEGKSDKLFIERLRQEITANFEVDEPIYSTIECECLGGLSTKKLEEKLQEIKGDIGKKGLDRIGILLDADNVGIATRVQEINDSVKCIDANLNITNINTWYKSDSLGIEISCHILNIDGRGELETILKDIKSSDSIFADCLNAWRSCVSNNNKKITDKEFDKFWISIYQSYDCCNRKEKGHKETKCNMEASLQKDIWDFTDPVLDDLKSYLTMFD
jgi:hypothetical protein